MTTKRGIIGILLAAAVFLAACGNVENPPIEWPDSGETMPDIRGTVPTVPELPDRDPEQDASLDGHRDSALKELSDFLNGEIRQGNRRVNFRYTGSQQLDATLLARMTCSLFVQLTDQGGGAYELQSVGYPGDSIVQAWKEKNIASLTGDEKAALDAALAIVEKARSKAETEIDLEILLHDALCEKITYNDSSTEVTDYRNPPRHLTALGALLDGDANCQGYTDAFYVLATLAGFETDRMTVDCGSTSHIVNTIKLDGSWYVVDVTFDDFNDKVPEVKNYHLFNAGKDFCQEYTWEPWMEYRPVREESDEHYFYYLLPQMASAGYQKAFYNLEELGQSVFRELLSGRSEQAVALMRRDAGRKDLAEILETLAKEEDVMLTCQIWVSGRGDNTYFYICTEK